MELPEDRKSAQLLGAPKYFTGKMCRNGHISPRYTNGGGCVECTKKRNREQYRADPVHALDTMKQWREDNSNKWKELTKNNRKRNNYKYAGYTAMRRFRKEQATPPWINEGHRLEIEEVYEQAALLTKERGESYNVDHIIPLQNSKVCGLHVPWNLQVIRKSENCRKSNKFNY